MSAITTLSDKTVKHLLHEMQFGIFCAETRLPPERELATQLGISRTILRDVLSVLEREGFISRKHGVGTLINRHVLSLENRMDLEREFLEMIAASGRKPSSSIVNITEKAADEELAQKLAIPLNQSVIMISRIVYADGEPAIYCEDHISKSILTKIDYKEADLQKPIFSFLEIFCNTEIHMDITSVSAILASDTLANVLQVHSGDALLYMDEIGYTFWGAPALYSKEYYVPNLVGHVILRKKI